jgi:hypothetical protein
MKFYVTDINISSYFLINFELISSKFLLNFELILKLAIYKFVSYMGNLDQNFTKITNLKLFKNKESNWNIN